MTFDPTKPVQTRDGRKARILATDGRGDHNGVPQPIIAEIQGQFQFVLATFCANGNFYSHREDEQDLINIPEAKKLRAWRLEEIGLPMVVRHKHWSKGEATLVIGKWVDAHGDVSVTISNNANTTVEELLEKFETLDGKPCGVEE